MKIEVRITPGANKEKVEKLEEGIYKAWVKEKAEDNKANHALLALLARHFNVPLGAVRLVAGVKSRHKTVVINGHLHTF